MPDAIATVDWQKDVASEKVEEEGGDGRQKESLFALIRNRICKMTPGYRSKTVRVAPSRDLSPLRSSCCYLQSAAQEEVRKDQVGMPAVVSDWG